MELKKIFNGIFFVNLLAVAVIAIQAGTGYFIDPKVQVAVLFVINWISRLMTGGIVIHDVKAPVTDKIELPKMWYESKMLWMSIVSFVGAAVQSVTGWVIPQETYLQIVSAISFTLSIVTHKPVIMK